MIYIYIFAKKQINMKNKPKIINPSKTCLKWYKMNSVLIKSNAKNLMELHLEQISGGTHRLVKVRKNVL